MSPEGSWTDDVEARFKEGIEFGRGKSFIHSGSNTVLVSGCRPEADYTDIRILAMNKAN